MLVRSNRINFSDSVYDYKMKIEENSLAFNINDYLQFCQIWKPSEVVNIVNL